MITKKNNYDVTKREDGWAVTKWGAERASYIGSTQEEAFERARELCITSGGGEVSVHGLNGKILRKHTYEKKDPYPPPG